MFQNVRIVVVCKIRGKITKSNRPQVRLAIGVVRRVRAIINVDWGDRNSWSNQPHKCKVVVIKSRVVIWVDGDSGDSGVLNVLATVVSLCVGIAKGPDLVSSQRVICSFIFINYTMSCSEVELDVRQSYS